MSMLHPRRSPIELILVPALPIGLFLGLLLSRLFPKASEGSCTALTCLFRIHVFHPLRPLSVFVFLKSVTFFLQTVLAV